MFGFLRTRNKAKKPLQRYRNRAAYRIVDGNASRQIAPSQVELKGEDEILDSSKRGKLLNVTRNLVRNSSLFSTLLSQLESNVVGTCGGKVILNFPDEELNRKLRKLFSGFTRNADYFDGQSFNHLLRIFLRQQIIGGDLVIVFDHDVEGSGKLIWFESDEIVNVDPSVIEAHYGKGCTQSLGKVYSPSMRWIGTVVSKSARGKEIADEDQCWFLHRDPNGNPLDGFWIQPSNSWRRSTRGISQAATAVNTATQLEDLVLSELEASRKNAQTFCWLKEPQTEEDETPTAFGDDVDVENLTDDEMQKLVDEESASTQTVSLMAAKENAVAFQQLPPGWDAQMLDTKHPNANVEAMTDYLSGRVAAVLGLARCFATGNPDKDNFRVQQLLTAPAMLQYQKDLERICDWAFVNFTKWLDRRGLFDVSTLDDDFMQSVSWEWKRLESADETATENANLLKLKNMTGSYREILGNDWKEKLLQVSEEVKWMRENGMTHPSGLMLSGGETTAEKANATRTEGQE